MLKFDPSQRITIEEALAHPYLTSVRNLAKEQTAACPMSADIETIGEDQEHIHANVSENFLHIHRCSYWYSVIAHASVVISFTELMYA
jgi:hypothetical protein